MDLGLTGRAALVAAGTSGLGLGTAVALAREGADVALCGRDPVRLAAAAAAVDAAGPGRVLASTVDVTDETAVAAWVDTTATELGGLHVVVTNGAGSATSNAATLVIEASTTDFNGDSQSDLIWRQSSTGRVIICRIIPGAASWSNSDSETASKGAHPLQLPQIRTASPARPPSSPPRHSFRD